MPEPIADIGKTILPALRPDIEIHRGPPALDGSPTCTVHDPLNRTFDKIGWAEALILERLRCETTLDDLLDHIAKRSTLRLTPQEVLDFCQEAANKGFTMLRATRPTLDLIKEHRKRKVSPMRWLLHHYLYFRVPLVRPDAFLGRTLPLVRPLGANNAMVVYAILALIGLVMCAERFSEYVGTFPYFFNWQGLVWFGLVMAAIKTVHEFSHAYTAKRYGLRVPTMGVAFMVMWPVAFCDVTDAWKMSDRRKRLAISSAGVKAELVIAGLALFGWGLTGPGLAHGIFFFISSSALASTLLININPAMRFDGYFLLMDFWGIDNLQPRAFMLAKWAYRKWLLGLDEPNPDPEISGARFWQVMAYSLYTWLYRLTLYAAIAVLVYEKFVKVLGIFFFFVEIWWFILLPALREGKALVDIRRRLSVNRRSLAMTLACAALFLWCVLPLSEKVAAPAVIVAARNQVVYAPFFGVIQNIAFSRGASVKKGDSLSLIQSDKLDADIKILEMEKQLARKKLELLGLDDQEKSLIPQQEEEIASTQARLSALYKQKEQSRQAVELDGVLYDWDETLSDGMAVRHQQVLGRIADLSELIIYAFVSEDRVTDLAPGHEVRFFSEDGSDGLAATITSINPVRTEQTEFLALTSAAKGSLPVVKQDKGKLTMVESYYAVEARLQNKTADLPIGQSGLAWLHAKPRSRLVDALRRVYRILVREISF